MTVTNQPKWKLAANLGDVNPVDYGGLFVFTDETGVYPPEMARLEPPADDDDSGVWELLRVTLDRCTDSMNGDRRIISDNKYHPEMQAWFGFRDADRPQDSCITDVARSSDIALDDLIGLLCSDDPLRLAEGYRAILDYHGWDNGDAYPLTMARVEAEAYVASL